MAEGTASICHIMAYWETKNSVTHICPPGLNCWGLPSRLNTIPGKVCNISISKQLFSLESSGWRNLVWGCVYVTATSEAGAVTWSRVMFHRHTVWFEVERIAWILCEVQMASQGTWRGEGVLHCLHLGEATEVCHETSVTFCPVYSLILSENSTGYDFF